MATIITAHSGAENTENNSLHSVEVLIAGKADALEVDVRKNLQGELILSHDRDESGEYAGAVTLEKVFKLAAMRPCYKINCDLKETDLERDVLAVAEKVGFGGLIYTGNVSEEIAADPVMRKKAELFFNYEDYHTMEQAVIECKKYGFCGVNPHYSFCTDEFIACMNENNLKISAWTVDDEAAIERLLKKGIYNITTNKVTSAINIKSNLK